MIGKIHNKKSSNKVTICNSLTSVSKNATRVGRGQGSKGKTCGRGYNGSKARSGYKLKAMKTSQVGFMTKFPKRGFKGIQKHVLELTISKIQYLVSRYNISEISIDVLKKIKYISSKKNFFLSVISSLNNTLDKSIKIFCNKISSSAKKVIESSNGVINLI